MRILTSLVSTFLFRTALGALYVAPQTLPRTEYDFIVVGAGTAGNVIAARLTENPNVTVAVIEAGVSDDGITGLEIPFFALSDLSNTSYLWPYNSVPQSGLDGRQIPIQRGKVLGGSSSVNFLFYTRGSQDDFNRYAQVTGDSGWSWNSILPYYKKLETFTAPRDGHNTTGQFNSSVHGFSGPLLTTLPGFPVDVDVRIFNTTQIDPEQFPFNIDMNGGNTIGIGWAQTTTGGGARSSSATAYLHPNLNRPNLDVLIGAQVTRLLTAKNDTTTGTTSSSTTPDLRTVEYAQNATTPRLTIQATKEVILAAGATNTPQILILSGIGNSKDLSTLGITTLINSPYVGQGLQDHPLIGMSWFSTENVTIDTINRNSSLANELISEWTTSRTGPLVDASSDIFGWLRVNSSVLQGPDPSAGPTSAHMELLTLNGFVAGRQTPPDAGSFFSVVTNVASPASRGTLKLTSSNPFDFPLIDPAFLTDQVDLNIAIESVSVAFSFVSQSPFKGFIQAPFGQLANATTRSDFEAYVKNQTVSFWHPCCTTKMGNASDPTAVVDSQLKLKGALGVRVVDASIFPYIPAAHTQAPVYAIAERAADIIKEAYHL